MSDSFDPYYSWLGVPPREQPPDHYRLLGLQRFESNVDVIANAADRQMAFVQSFKSGKHASESQRLLNEISSAKLCLLNKTKKADYDAQLNARLAASSSLSTIASKAMSIDATASLPPIDSPTEALLPSASLPSTSLPAAAYPPLSADPFDQLPPVAPFRALAPISAGAPSGTAIPIRAQLPAMGSPSPPWALIAGVGCGVVAVLVVLPFLFSRSPAKKSDTVVAVPAPVPISTTLNESNEPDESATSLQPTTSVQLTTESTAASSSRTPLRFAPGAATSATSPIAPEFAPPALGEWVDLLAWTEGVDWKPRGIDWNSYLESPLTRDAAVLKQQKDSRFPLAAIIEGDYDLELCVQSRNGRPPLGVVFPVGRHNLQLELGAPNGDGVRFIDRELDLRKMATTRRPSKFFDDKLHALKIHVRQHGDDAEFAIDVDDVVDYIHWNGDAARLTNFEPDDWRVSMTRRLWLLARGDVVAFSRVRLKMLTGRVQRDVITDADRARDLQHGFVRLVGEPASQVKIGWNSFVVDQYPLDTGPGGVERLWPLVTERFARCTDNYWVHPPSRLGCPIPSGAKSFSIVGYNAASRVVKYQIAIDDKLVYDSGEADIRVIKIPLPSRASTLQLIVDPAGLTEFDHTWWCYPRFHAEPVAEITDAMLTADEGEFKFTVESHKTPEWAPYSHQTGAGVSQNDALIDFHDAQPCDEFFYAHAPSNVTYLVPAGMTRFTAVGYNSLTYDVKYEVWVDGKQIYQSPQCGVVAIDVKLPAGTRSIDLRVNELGDKAYDSCVWCYPRLHKD